MVQPTTKRRVLQLQITLLQPKSTRQGTSQLSTSTVDRSAPKSTVSYTNPPMRWTTSTVYTTRVLTFYSCAPEVETSDCPDGPHFTTETILMSTTVCPVTEIGTSPQHTQVATVIADASTGLYPPAPNPTSSAASISSAPTVQHPDPTETTTSIRPSGCGLSWLRLPISRVYAFSPRGKKRFQSHPDSCADKA